MATCTNVVRTFNCALTAISRWIDAELGPEEKSIKNHGALFISSLCLLLVFFKTPAM